MRRALAIAFALVLAASVAWVYGGALGHPLLLSHDDGAYLAANPGLAGPPGEAVRVAFTATPLGTWAPLHLLSYVLDLRLWGSWAGGIVLGNLLLHALCSALLAWIVLRLDGSRLGAATAGLLFAVHPVQVESVVWISQRKTLLSAVFLLLALHFWISYLRAGQRPVRPYLLAIGSAIAASLSKAVSVVLPGILVLLDVRLGRRLRGRALLDKLPFVVIALATALVTIALKREVGASLSMEGHTRAPGMGGGFAYHGGSPLATFWTMTTVLPRYLALLVWPGHLSAVYVPPVRTVPDAEVWISLLLLVALLGATAVLLVRAPRWGFWMALFFLGLLPVSQLVPQTTLMNDRYLYVPMFGVAGLVAEAVRALTGGEKRIVARAAAPALGAVLAVLAVSAHARVPVWRSDLALWTDAVGKAPRSAHAWFNLGRSREAAGDAAEALRAYERAIELDPLDSDAVINAGALLLRQGDLSVARGPVERGAALAPDSVEAQFNLGLLRFLDRRLVEAEAPLRRASELGPRECPPRVLLGHVEALLGHAETALALYRATEADGCMSAEARLYRALAEAQLGDEAAAQRTLGATLGPGGQLDPARLGPTALPLLEDGRFQALLDRWGRGAAASLRP